MPGRSATLTMRDVGRRVAELRAARGWTQEALAERAGVSLTYVRQVEGGGENLTIETICKFAALFSVDARELFDLPASREKKRGRPKKLL